MADPLKKQRQPRRPVGVQLQHAEAALEMHCEGIGHYRIAAKLGISSSQAWASLEKAFSGAKARLNKKAHEHLTDLLLRFEKVEREAWAEWHRSKEIANSVRKRTKGAPITPASGDAGGQSIVVEDVTTRIAQGRLGDPRYLERITDALMKRAHLLGLIKGGASSSAGTTIEKAVITIVDGNDALNTYARALQQRADDLRRASGYGDSAQPGGLVPQGTPSADRQKVS